VASVISVCCSCGRPWDTYLGKRRCYGTVNGKDCGVPVLVCEACLTARVPAESLRCRLCDPTQEPARLPPEPAYGIARTAVGNSKSNVNGKSKRPEAGEGKPIKVTHGDSGEGEAKKAKHQDAGEGKGKKAKHREVGEGERKKPKHREPGEGEAKAKRQEVDEGGPMVKQDNTNYKDKKKKKKDKKDK